MNYNENANLDDGSCNYFCGLGTRLDPVTGKCELTLGKAKWAT